MQTLEAIENRRAVREYEGTPVSRATIQRLVASAVLAPSAMNLQPWAFAAISGVEKVATLGQRAKEWLLANLERAGLDPSLRKLIQPDGYRLFHGAPAIVLVLATSPVTQAAEDCCLAAQNLMLAARDEGLGTCWIGLARPWLNLTSVKHELGLSDKLQVVAPIILGQPKAWPESHGRRPAELYWIG